MQRNAVYAKSIKGIREAKQEVVLSAGGKREKHGSRKMQKQNIA
jgi:hypothetical protein